MAAERLYFVARLLVAESAESLILLPDSIPSTQLVQAALRRLHLGRSWAQANPSEIERLALSLREFAHNAASLLQEQHPGLAVLGIDVIQNTFLNKEFRSVLAAAIAPALAGSLISSDEPPIADPLPEWRSALRQRGPSHRFLASLLFLHQHLVAVLLAEHLKLAWRPAPLLESTITDIPVPLSSISTKPSYLYVMNNLPYHAVREALAFGLFSQSPDSPWPTAELNKGGTHGQAQLFPVEVELNPYREPGEQKLLIDNMWNQVSELSDLDADVLDLFSAIWIEHAKDPNDFARISIKQLLKLRGLKPKSGEDGRASGYRPEQKAQLFRAIQRISSLFLLIQNVDVPRPGDTGRERRELRSRAFVITDILGNRASSSPSAPFDIEEFLIRPGVLFGHFLFGPGRQLALLSSKAIHYDRIRQDWEKRLARYLSWQWRNDAVNQRASRTFLVRTLLENAGKTVDPKHPRRARLRLEKALNQLSSDGVIASWTWENNRSGSRELSKWQEYWTDWSIRIEAPEFIRRQYQYILPASSQGQVSSAPAKSTNLDLSGMLFEHRQRHHLSQAAMAAALGITQSYYSMLERGARSAPPETRQRILQLLNSPL